MNKYLCLALSLATSVHAQTTNLLTPNNISNSNAMKINVINPGKEITVRLVVPGSSSLLGLRSAKCQIENIPAKEILYKNGSITNSFVVIRDPYTEKSYVFPSSNPNYFYISYNSGMVACYLGSGGYFMWFERYFEVSKSQSIDDILAKFVLEFDDDQKTSEYFRNVPRVFLNRSAHRAFFSVNSNSTAPTIPTIKAIDLNDEILRLDFLSDGGKFAGSFWIDLKAKKIIKSVVKDAQTDKQIYPESIF